MLQMSVQVVSRRLLYNQDQSRVAAVQMLERDLCNELEGIGRCLGLLLDQRCVHMLA